MIPAITPDELRLVIREEFARLVPELRQAQTYLSIRETATRFRLGYDTVKLKVERGELRSVKRSVGRSGRAQVMILLSDAEAKLGPGAAP